MIKAVMMAEQLVKGQLQHAKCVVDATAGNGKDTLLLARRSPSDCIIWAFDIQQQAIDNTTALLQDNGVAGKVRLIHDCHSRIGDYIQQPVNVAIFNLGYLPGADHSITTKAATTIIAVEQVLALLPVGGIVSLITYPGHGAGVEEHERVKLLLTSLPHREYSVGCWQMINKMNDPPFFYLIEKEKLG